MDNINLHRQQTIKNVGFSTQSIIKETIRIPEIIPQWKHSRGYILKYSQKTNRDPNRCILFVHGGSFTKNQPRDDTYQTLCVILSHLTSYDVYCPDYTLAPHATYPTQPNEILNLTRYLSKTYNKIILGADSAGGTIGLSCIISSPKLYFASFFISPWIDLQNNSASYKTRAWSSALRTGDPIFNQSTKTVKKFSDKLALEYLQFKNRLQDPIANPIKATDEALRKVPPILIIGGDNEVLRNETLEFVSRAQQANQTTSFSLYDMMWHDFPLYYQTASKEMGEQAYHEIAAFCHGVKRFNSFSYQFQPKIPVVKANIYLKE